MAMRYLGLTIAILGLLSLYTSVYGAPQIEIWMHQHCIQPGQDHILMCHVKNDGLAVDLDFVLALEAFDKLYFYPDFKDEFTVIPLQLPGGIDIEAPLFTFYVPEGVPVDTFRWYCAFLWPGTMDPMGPLGVTSFRFSTDCQGYHPFYPLDDGDVWEMNLKSFGITIESIKSVIGEELVDGKLCRKLQTITPDQPEQGGFTYLIPESESGTVWIKRTTVGNNPIDYGAAGTNGSLLVKNFFQPGDSWQYVAIMEYGQGQTYHFAGTTTVIGAEPVFTPAGYFRNDTYRTYTSALSGSGNAELQIDSWYCRGIGPLKTITKLIIYGIPLTTEEVLTDFDLK